MLRIFLALSLLAIGLLVGHVIAQEAGAIVAAVCVMALLLLWDSWSANHIMRWLKGEAHAAPKLVGFWNEMLYRMSQRLRVAERDVIAEKNKLDHFLTAIQASPNGVALLDGEDKIEWCNAQLADHLGIDQERDRGQRIVFVVRNPEFVAYLAKREFSSPATITLSNLRLLEVQCFPFGERKSNDSGRDADDILLLTRDVTEQQRTDIMRRDFVANVSHELKTPLTVLKGFLETVHGLELEPAEREHYLKVMLTQADRMHNLVNDLLTLAKLEADVRTPETTTLQMHTMMDALKAQAQALSLGRHKVVKLQCDDWNLLGNQSELMSAFSNLVSNAVRYTPNGGNIAIAWQKTLEGAVFSVTDTGIGIAEEHLSRVTERFYRIDKGRAKLDAEGREIQGGTGLGLAIVKHALQRHGAELRIESEQGVGSKFMACFPLSRIAPAAQQVAASSVKIAA